MFVHLHGECFMQQNENEIYVFYHRNHRWSLVSGPVWAGQMVQPQMHLWKMINTGVGVAWLKVPLYSVESVKWGCLCYCVFKCTRGGQFVQVVQGELFTGLCKGRYEWMQRERERLSHQLFRPYRCKLFQTKCLSRVIFDPTFSLSVPPSLHPELH